MYTCNPLKYVVCIICTSCNILGSRSCLYIVAYMQYIVVFDDIHPYYLFIYCFSIPFVSVISRSFYGFYRVLFLCPENSVRTPNVQVFFITHKITKLLRVPTNIQNFVQWEKNLQRRRATVNRPLTEQNRRRGRGVCGDEVWTQTANCTEQIRNKIH